jgi:hypothetical protein
MPAKLQTLLQQMKTLPADFTGQRIAVKRQIISVLQAAKDMIDSLNEEIEVLKMDSLGQMAKKRAQPVINLKQNHIAVILQTMSRFHADDP